MGDSEEAMNYSGNAEKAPHHAAVPTTPGKPSRPEH